MSVIDAEDSWPLRPRVIVGAIFGWTIHQFEVHELRTAMTQTGSDAIRTCVTTTYNNDFLTSSRDERLVAVRAIEQRLRIRAQKLHCKVDALETATGNRQITRLGRAGCQ